MKFLTVAHFDDIVVERAIINFCGYPLCQKPKGETPKQKFKINTKTNKVHDLSQQKNFCSVKCMNEALILKEQISETPLWLRNGQEKPVVFNDENLPLDATVQESLDLAPRPKSPCDLPTKKKIPKERDLYSKERFSLYCNDSVVFVTLA